MVAERFELWLGCFGNGTTVCNKAIERSGEYKRVAHISNAGNITLYVEEDYIPLADMARIRSAARRSKEEFKRKFERMSPARQYETICNRMPWSMMNAAFIDTRPLLEKLPELREAYYEIA